MKELQIFFRGHYSDIVKQVTAAFDYWQLLLIQVSSENWLEMVALDASN